MGPRNSKQAKNSFMTDYDIIQRNQAENLTYLQHKTTQQEYLLREFNFNDKKQFDKTLNKLTQLKTKLAGNKHVTPLKDFLTSSEDQYCSTFYKIYAVFEYPQRTLDDEINQRNLHKRKFSEAQLWSILASCIVGMSHLQKNGIRHSALRSSSILLSQEGIIKVADPFSTGTQPNYDVCLTKRTTPHLYLSPEQTAALQQQLINPTLNHYKSDIWTLGMIILEAGLLEYQDQCYRDELSRIHWETLHYSINRLGQSYSEQIKNMIEFMLSRDERARPDWLDLGEHVMKSDQGKRSFIQQQGIQIQRGSIVNNNSSNNTHNAQYLQNKPPIYHYQEPQAQEPRISMGIPNFSNTNNYRASTFSPRNTNLSHNIIPARTSQLPIQYQHSNFIYPGPRNPSAYRSSSIGQGAPLGTEINQLNPIKISFIDQSRPLRNIFPVCTYQVKTKIDENLILVEEEEDEDLSTKGYPETPMYSGRPFRTTYHENQQQQQPISNEQLQFVVEHFKKGSQYEGYKKDGMRHGHGKFLYQDGGMYDGEWFQNKMNGYGKLYYQSGKLAYEGYWKADQFTGYGTLYNEAPQILQGMFQYENMGNIEDYWVKYEGQFCDDMKNGRGILYLSNGQKFEGNFESDQIKGRGIFYRKNGEQAHGKWQDNIKVE